MTGNQERTRAAVDHLVFLGKFIRHPRTVGSVIPSSRFLARRMVKDVAFRPGVKVVELGPGTGSFTTLLAGLLPAGGRYLGIEREADFVRVLRRRLPEIDCVCDSVVNLVSIAGEKDFLPVDHFISGLPFATLPAAVTLPVLDAVHESLRPGGTFTTFQYLYAYLMPPARRFRKEMALRFGPPSAMAVVLRNFPPAFVFTWTKGLKEAR